MNSYNKGFGLIGLFITFLVVGLAGWGTYSSLLKTKSTNENSGGQGFSAINEAEKAKQFLSREQTIDPNNPHTSIVNEQGALELSNESIILSKTPLDFSKTRRFFKKTSDGGIEAVLAIDSADTFQVELIKRRTREEVAMFFSGDFSNPLLFHDMTISSLTKFRENILNSKISYSSGDISDGAYVRYTTKDVTLVPIIHHFFDTQVSKSSVDKNLTSTSGKEISAHPSTSLLVLISPSGGEILCVGDTFEIKWKAPKDMDTSIEVELDGGIRAYGLGKIVANYQKTSEEETSVYPTYSWIVGADFSSSTIKITPGTYTMSIRGKYYLLNDYWEDVWSVSEKPFSIQNCEKS